MVTFVGGMAETFARASAADLAAPVSTRRVRVRRGRAWTIEVRFNARVAVARSG